MIKAVVPALLIVTAITRPASAAFWQGNDLVEACQNDKQFALGYTTALSDVMGGRDEISACVPAEATAGQIRNVVCKFLTDHPEKLHETAHRLGATALIEAFPCNK